MKASFAGAICVRAVELLCPLPGYLLDWFADTSGTATPDPAVLNYTLDIYPPYADADGDRFPDVNEQPILSVPTADTPQARRINKS
jgi:hypothetical protein